MDIFNQTISYSPERSNHYMVKNFCADVFTGALTPVWWKELVPGDNLKQNYAMVIKALPMVKPVFGRVTASLNSFFIPFRIMDDNFIDRLTGGENAKSPVPYQIDSTEDSFDNIQSTKSPTKYSLKDYLGYPMYDPNVDGGSFLGSGILLSPYPWLAYNWCWNEYYRSERQCVDANGDPIKDRCKIGEGTYLMNDSPANSYGPVAKSGIKYVYLEHDYFTCCLPTRQFGTSPAFPISGILPINLYDRNNDLMYDSNNNPVNMFYDIGSYVDRFGTSIHKNLVVGVGQNPPLYQSELSNDALRTKSGSSPSAWHTSTDTNMGDNEHVNRYFEDLDVGAAGYKMGVDVSNGFSFNVDEFREIMAIQKYLEKINVCGSHYNEYLRAIFSVAPNDETIQKPVWLGGTSVDIMVSEIIQTSESNTTPLGEKGGVANSFSGNNLCEYFCKEPGIIMTLLHIRPKVTYTQGWNRSLYKPTKYDYLNPMLCHLSEQPVYKGELFAKGVADKNTPSNALSILGFNPRYAEYYTEQDQVCGDLRDTMSYWTWSRRFKDDVTLNAELNLCKAPEFADKFVVTDKPSWIVEYQNRLDITRPIPADPSPR